MTTPAPGGPTRPADDRPDLAGDLAEELAELETDDSARPCVGLPPDRHLDRQLSWLEFNARVLALAADPDLPLLERVRFLAIFAGNLDEFFMVRVAGLKQRIARAGGSALRERLARVAARAHALVDEHARVHAELVAPALSAHGIVLTCWRDLDPLEQARTRAVFTERIAPVLTPLAVDPARPFPYISGLSLNLAVVVRAPDGREHFARVKVPPSLPRLLPLPGGRFLPLEELIAAHLPELFTGMEVVESTTFRVTRNEDLDLEDEDVGDLLVALEDELRRRRFGPPVRLEVEAGTPPRVLDLLVRELGVAQDDVYRLPAPLDLRALWQVAALERPELDHRPFTPLTPARLRGEDGTADVLSALRERDLLVHHPYDSFATTVQAFVEQAAADPSVLAIKQTLYRTSGDSPIVRALVEAAHAGKQVLVVVEIKARFDEHANIRWARALEQAGCHVVYGLIGLKTHCKLSLVVREEADGSLRRYAHVGTGNYNPKTARQYEDLGLLTADPEIGRDVADLFNHLSGYTSGPRFDTLLVAPHTLRPGLLDRIAVQRDRALAGEPARVRLKVNNLVDEPLVDALYEASRAGVDVDVVVRGMCSLRPGLPGLSERVHVRSVLGRFLEHSRVFEFGVGDTRELWIGSADVMMRNLDRRVEALVRLRDPEVQQRVSGLLDQALSEATSCFVLAGDGTWSRRTRRDDGTPCVDLQEALIDVALATRPAEEDPRPA